MGAREAKVRQGPWPFDTPARISALRWAVGTICEPEVLVVREDVIARAALDASIAIHRKLGPGLLESVYELALANELARRGFRVARQFAVSAVVDGVAVECAFRADIVVDDIVVVEVKAVEKLADVHKRQVLTYAKLMNVRLGLLINFGEARLVTGFKRIANGMPDDNKK